MNTLPKQDAATPPEDSTIRLIPLTQGKFAIVDASDFDWLSRFHWQAHYDKKRNTWYVSRGKYDPATGLQHTVRMHREILDAPKRAVVDHKDGNGLNNSRSNIRICSNLQNQWNRGKTRINSSGFKGVFWDKETRKWKAAITANGKPINLGRFRTAVEAANAYTEAAARLHGEFAKS